MITENLSTLKIHKLTNEQYKRALNDGNIEENAMYLTPDEEGNVATGSPVEIREAGTIYIKDIEANIADDATITIKGKNLIDDVAVLDQCQWESLGGNRYAYEFDVTGPNTYVLSFTKKYVGARSDYLYLQVYSADEEGNFKWNSKFYFYRNGWEMDSVKFTLLENEKVRFWRYMGNNDLAIDGLISDVLLEAGSDKTTYAPYVAPITMSYQSFKNDKIHPLRYGEYVKITNSENANMTVSYTVNDIVMDYISNLYTQGDETLYVTPQMFGARGDGMTDDTVALQNAINSGYKVIVPKTTYSYKFTTLTIPQDTRLEINGTMASSHDHAINIIGRNVTISGNGKLSYNGTGSLVYIDLAGKQIEDIRISVPMVGNETKPDTKTCVAIEITLGSTEYGFGYRYYIDSSITSFNVGVWHHKEDDSNEDTWSSCIFFNGSIENCTEAIKIECSATGSQIGGTIQPDLADPNKNEVARILDKPLVTLARHSTLTAMIWDGGDAVNKYIIRLLDQYNIILNDTWFEIDKDIKIDNPRQSFLPNTAQINRPQIHGQYHDNLNYTNSMNNILLNADKNKNITITTAADNCTLVNPTSVFSTVNKFMRIRKDDNNKPASLEMTFEFPNEISLNNISVTGEQLTDQVRFEVYDNEDVLIASKDTAKGNDYFYSAGGLSVAYWKRDFGKVGIKTPTEAYVKKFKIIMSITAENNEEVWIYQVIANDGTDVFLPQAGGNMTGILGTNGINLTYKTDYGATMPSDATNGRLFFTPDDTADRVLKFGLDNGWYYRKWESGIAECWRSENRTITSGEWNDGKGGGISAGLITISASALAKDIQYNFPSSKIFTFIQRPTEIASISNNTSWRSLTLMGRDHSSVTLSTTKLYNIITYNPEDSLDVTMNFYVIGRWK